MFKVGLTGGIGSGKTTVAKVFESLGIPVYNSDNKAKYLMNNDDVLVRKITLLFGVNAYVNKKLNTGFIGEIVFSNKEKLIELEKIVHPVVKNDFIKWAEQQESPYVIMENAILHKSGMHELVDCVVLVTAPIEIRVKRIKKRDNLTSVEIRKRISIQDNDEKLLKKSDYAIENNVSKSKLLKNIKNIDRNLKIMLNKC